MPRAAPMLRSSNDGLLSSLLSSHVSSNARPLCWPSRGLLPFVVVCALRDDSACAEEAIRVLSSASSASISRCSSLPSSASSSSRPSARFTVLTAFESATPRPRRYFARRKSLTLIVTGYARSSAHPVHLLVRHHVISIPFLMAIHTR